MAFFLLLQISDWQKEFILDFTGRGIGRAQVPQNAY